MNGETGGGRNSMALRLREELVKYGLVSGYLFISFSLLLIYEATATGGGREVLPFGIALVKALVFGKFLLIGDALKVGSRANAHPLLHRVALKTLAFLAVLLIFKTIEELVVGLFHQKTVGAVIGDVLQRGWLENFAPVLVMLLILIPLVAISESYRQLGPERFRELWLE